MTSTHNIHNTGELIQIYGLGKQFKRVHELLYFLPVNVSYEVDLWGRIRDQFEAAGYNWNTSLKDYESIMLSLTSDSATAYFQLRAADSKEDLLLETLKTRQIAFDINQARYEERIINYSDVTLAGEDVNNVITQYYETLRQRAVLENQIAVLIGSPASEFCLEHLPLDDLPPCIPEGLPSDILLQRPDIAEAEYTMMAQHALAKEVYTGFFPL